MVHKGKILGKSLIGQMPKDFSRTNPKILKSIGDQHLLIEFPPKITILKGSLKKN